MEVYFSKQTGVERISGPNSALAVLRVNCKPPSEQRGDILTYSSMKLAFFWGGELNCTVDLLKPII